MGTIYHIPRDIDAPTPLFFWTVVEVIIAICFVGFGLLMGSLGIGLLLGIGILSVSKHMHNDSAKRGEAQHLMWRFGLKIDKSMNWFPPALRMEFIE